MTHLRNSILATVCYYDILEHPLTLFEIYKFLINPGRIARMPNGVGEISVPMIADQLEELIRSGILGSKNGFYFLHGRGELYDLRMEHSKISAQKWKKFLKLCSVLALVPYLRGVFASGSMALGNTDNDSDFDVLLIFKSRRLYSGRLFLWSLTSLLRIRRRPDQKIAPDKLCFNHFIGDRNLIIRHESLFNAQTYANLKPIMISNDLVDLFYQKNLWINDYVFNFRVQKEFARRRISPNRILVFMARTVEKFFDGICGEAFEKISRYVQHKKIKNNPVTYESGGRVVFNDNELEFHPHSFEATVIDKYKKGLRRLGIVSYIEERDSGLRR